MNPLLLNTMCCPASCLAAACQILRIISFTVTQLPAPNYHCRLGKDTAVREMPEHWWGHVVVDVGRQASGSMGGQRMQIKAAVYVALGGGSEDLAIFTSVGSNRARRA